MLTTNEADEKTGTPVPTATEIPSLPTWHTGDPTGEFGGLCGNCSARTYRISQSRDGHHFREYDRCPNCGAEADPPE